MAWGTNFPDQLPYTACEFTMYQVYSEYQWPGINPGTLLNTGLYANFSVFGDSYDFDETSRKSAYIKD
jgi:hypothetical protein